MLNVGGETLEDAIKRAVEMIKELGVGSKKGGGVGGAAGI